MGYLMRLSERCSTNARTYGVKALAFAKRHTSESMQKPVGIAADMVGHLVKLAYSDYNIGGWRKEADQLNNWRISVALSANLDTDNEVLKPREQYNDLFRVLRPEEQFKNDAFLDLIPGERFKQEIRWQPMNFQPLIQRGLNYSLPNPDALINRIVADLRKTMALFERVHLQKSPIHVKNLFENIHPKKPE